MEAGEKEHRKEHHRKSISFIYKKLTIENILLGAAVLLGIVLVINVALTFNIGKDLKNAAESIKEAAKPAKIEIMLVENSKCTDCFDISAVISQIKNANVNVTKETRVEFNSREGREITTKYSIEKVPAVIVTGEIGKLDIGGLEKKENAFVLAAQNPPYTNAATGKIEGRVALYILREPSCEKCSDLAPLISQIKGAGVRISEEKILAPDSKEGSALIKKYNIGFAPSIVLSRDASAYVVVQQAWPHIGTRETDGNYVLRLASPPFINLTTGKLNGLVDIVYLTDKSCQQCYNVNQHREILVHPQSFAIKLEKEETSDISDARGKELIAKYNITQIPTVVLSGEVGVYPSSQALKQFFSVEKDGSYVFRKVPVVGTYKDLATGQVVSSE